MARANWLEVKLKDRLLALEMKSVRDHLLPAANKPSQNPSAQPQTAKPASGGKEPQTEARKVAKRAEMAGNTETTERGLPIPRMQRHASNRRA